MGKEQVQLYYLGFTGYSAVLWRGRFRKVGWALLMRPTKVQVALLLVLSVVEIHLPPTTGSASQKLCLGFCRAHQSAQATFLKAVLSPSPTEDFTVKPWRLPTYKNGRSQSGCVFKCQLKNKL